MGEDKDRKALGRKRIDAVQSVGLAMEALDSNLDKLDQQGFIFVGMNLKAPNEDRQDWLVTIRAEVEGRKVVAFHSAFSLAEVVDQAIRRFSNRQLQWKDDNYAK